MASAWDKCEAPLVDEAPRVADGAAGDGGSAAGDGGSAADAKYWASLATVVAVLLVLWFARPPFACGAAKAGRAPPLLVGRAFALAAVAGGVVLFAEPLCALAARARSLHA